MIVAHQESVLPNKSDIKTCYLIGEDSMSQCCANIMIEEGYNLMGICSSDILLKAFAEKYDIPYTDSLETLSLWMRKTGCNFLFSIVNGRIINPDLIALPSEFSINFHNAPLPKYAGVHATSWAILNKENQHGSTWHILEEDIDTGDILKQEIFDIDEYDTGFSLNIKCVESGVRLFKKLIAELSDGSYFRIPQKLSLRSYYSLHQKPKYFGVIRWNEFSSEDIYRLHRASDFFEYVNKFCILKFIIGTNVFSAKKVEIVSQKNPTAPPGTIVEISEKGVRIATTTDDVFMSKIVDIHKRDLDINKFVSIYNIKEGMLLQSLAPEFLNKLKEYGEELAKNETFWVKMFEQSNSLNFISFGTKENHERSFVDTQLNKYIVFDNALLETKDSFPFCFKDVKNHALATVIFLYIYRLNNYENFTIGYKSQYVNKKELSYFFSEIVPINVEFTPDITFLEAIPYVSKLIERANVKKTFSNDLFLRYPSLSEITLALPIVICYSDPIEFSKESIYVVIKEDNVLLYFPDDLGEINLKIVKNIPVQLNAFIKGIVSDYTVSVKDLPLLSDPEKKLLIYDYNNTTTDFPRNSSVVDVFEQQVEKYPDNIAISHNGDFLTYRELNEKANQFATYLINLGVNRDGIVATYFNKGINSILSILSVIKAGGTYTPIDPMYPEEYVKYIIKDTCAAILLTQEKDRINLEKCLPSGKFIVLSIDNPDTKVKIFEKEENKKNLGIKIRATDLAYVMYTSGSTGAPKGVMIPHRGIVRLVKNTDYINFESTDCISQAASISFDAATFEIWGALLNGARLACADNMVISDSKEFSRFLHEEKVSISIFVSAVFDRHASADPSMFRKVRCLLVGGDVLNVDTIYAVANCSEGSPDCILNIYGPTENSNCTTIYSIPKNFDRKKTIPIGKPIANTTTYVLDKHLNVMPIGIPGELCTGGDGLADGYWNKKELTNEKFVEVDFDGKKTRIYKIGDLARWLPDGNLDYICRLDNQVKIRGFRMEIDAIEIALLNCNLISQCAVVVKQDDHKRKTLVAYIVLKGKRKDIAPIRTFLKKHLPHYMIPNVFIIKDSLPQTPNGKVDKKVLLKDFQQKVRDYGECIIHPRTELENNLATIWKSLLNIDLIGINENFFDLGGHSLLVTEMLIKIRKDLGLDFSLPAFLESPTIESLSTLIELSDENRPRDNIIHVVSQFDNDVFLDPKVKPISKSCESLKSKDMRVAFLTGVTGFLGAHLLDDLYSSTSSKIYCLIRGLDKDDAEQRFKETILKYDLNRRLLSDNKRVEVVLGDLSKPKLEIEDKLFDKISEEVDDIYHCGAHVHHIYNYEMLRDANVLSTLEIIKLATLKKDKRIHYISTLSAVVDCTDEKHRIPEDFHDIANPKLSSMNGYAQTKLASEIILSKAKKRGIFASIYRPTWIIGNQKTGKCAFADNHLFLLLKGCMQMKKAPNLDTKLSMLPVDFVSSFIVGTSINNEHKEPKVFNLVSDHIVEWKSLIEGLNNYGYKIDLIDPSIWTRDYLSKINDNNALYSLISLYSDGGLNWASSQDIFLNSDVDNVITAKKILGLSYNNVINNIIKNCLEYFREDSFMEMVV